MKTLIALLSTALLASALTAQAAPKPPPITITYLPFTISAPGTYVLATDLTFPPTATYGSAINVATYAATEPVIIDFKGHTITGPGPATVTLITGEGINDVINNSSGIVIAPDVNNPVTIRNGTLSNFQRGVTGGSYAIPVNYVTINSMIFNIPTSGNPNQGSYFYGISFECPFNCSVNDCTFNAESFTDSSGSYGIIDSQALASNSYNNNTFNGVTAPLSIGLFFDFGLANIVIDHYHSGPVPPPKK